MEIISGVGIFLCLLMASLFIKNRNVKLIKASSKQLMAFILIGIIMSYVTVYTLLYWPTIVSCYLARFGFFLSVSFIYAPLMIKTNRIYRIFSAGRKGFRRPGLTGERAQVFMVTICLILEVSLSKCMQI